MFQRRPPWWIVFALGCCTSYVLSVWYVVAAGPEELGVQFRLEALGANRLIVETVEPGSAADRAGLRAGDVILSVNGRTGRVAERELDLAQAGSTYDFLADRDGEHPTLRLTLGRRGLAAWTGPDGLIQVAYVLMATLCIALAWVTAFRRRDDTTALLGALMLGLWPVGLIHLEHGAPLGLDALWVNLPGRLGVVPLLAVIGAASLFPCIALTFFASFPRRLVRGRWIWALVWAPAPVAFVILLARNYTRLYRPVAYLTEPFVGLSIIRGLGYAAIVYFLAMPVLLAWNYHSATDINARRRLRVLIAGIVLATLVRLFHFVLWRFASASVVSYEQSPWFLAASVLVLAGPCAMAYAILRHRMFDLHVMVRQGLQYAAARGVLLGLAPIFGVLLVADLALHANQTMAEAFVQRGWFYAALGVAALAAHAKRSTWLEALDRRFFRERYDAQRVLRGLLTDIRQAESLGDAAPQAIARITEALHPTCAAILRRGPEEAAFRAVASSGPAPLEIPADSKLMALVRLLGKPLENPRSETAWLRQQLPPDESRWLKSTFIEWIFPIGLGATGPEALLVLGPKRSEEPYSREDQDLIEGVTSGLALLHERLTSAIVRRGATPRPEALVVPPIAVRYVIQRELGRGGMGTVYEGRDTELDRGIAIKVMRPELVASAEAAARFKREARAAASFSHPNVVTVYDVGVADDGRAYLVMELLSGRTLRVSLREDRRFAPARAAAILRGIGAAVEAAHQRHLLHRDLKPENVFLAVSDTGEVPKILDFGIAKLLPPGEETVTLSDTSPGQLLGTVAYMSPDQLRGLPAAPAWDLWALAVIAYEMVTGAHPFGGASLRGPVDLETRRAAPVPLDLGADRDRWDAFFAAALAPEARERPSSARELVAAFEAVAGTGGR